MNQLRELCEINSIVVCKPTCEFFKMNYSKFEGVLNELGNYGNTCNSSGIILFSFSFCSSIYTVMRPKSLSNRFRDSSMTVSAYELGDASLLGLQVD